MGTADSLPVFRAPGCAPTSCLVRSAGGLERREEPLPHGGLQLLDLHHGSGACVCHLRLPGAGLPSGFSLALDGRVDELLVGGDVGVVARVSHAAGRCTVWLPQHARRVMLDDSGRLADATGPGGIVLGLGAELRLHLQAAADGLGEHVLSYLVVDDPDGSRFAEIQPLGADERIRYLKSVWFDARVPADLWNYLVAGSVFDPRCQHGINRRFKCQQCAFAWWTYLEFLHGRTRKAIYQVLRDEVAWSVLLDQAGDGAWRHGFWHEDMEIHSRFFLDGVQLLMAQYRVEGERHWLDGAVRATDWFLMHLSEPLEGGARWFLHDSIEALRPHRFASTLFGKSQCNSLCLNTHVQAMNTLQHVRRVADPDGRYGHAFACGLAALELALRHRPGGWFYRWAMRWLLARKFDPRPMTRWGRYTRPFCDQVAERFYWALRERFPQLVQPGGFIERDLSLLRFSDGYLVINLKDLLQLYELQPADWLVPFIREGVGFARRLDFEKALRSNKLFVEWPDVLQLYGRLIEPVPAAEIDAAIQVLARVCEGVSLNFATMAVVESGQAAHP